MTKGAGMIHPNMATLLSLIATDCKIDPRSLRGMLRHATKPSFNSISIDGDTSTNDTCAIFANGAAAPPDVPPISVTLRQRTEERGFGEGKPRRLKAAPLANQSEDYRAFQDVLTGFMTDLAKLVVRDGEGATKFVTVRVENAINRLAARHVANAIVRSPLVKTALYGKDANWGRILCAIGYAPGANGIIPEKTSVSFVPTDGSEELKLLVNGEPEQVDEARAKEILEMEDLEILVKLDEPSEAKTGEVTMWTCDFSHEYVTINGDYRT